MMLELTIEEIAISIKTGKTPSTGDKLNFENGEYNWFTPGDFRVPKILTESKRKITDYAAKSNAVIYKPNTILITCIGDIGNAGIIKNEASANQQITGVNVNADIIIPEFFLYWVKANKQKIQDEANQAVVPIINNKGLKRIKVKFPSDLPTQNKIVALLDKASALVQKREKSIAVLDELLRAQFLDMFGDPVLNPKGWGKEKFKNINNGIESGWSPVCNDIPRKNSEEWAVLKQGAVSRRVFISTENKQLPEGKEIKKEVIASKGDVLFSRKNSAQFVGATAYVFGEYEKLLLPDTIFKLLLKLNLVRPLYIYQLFNDDNFKLTIQNLKNGAASSMPNISKVKLNDLELPVPPIELQNQFETIYHNIQAQKETLTQSKTELEHLYNSLLQRAFNGQLNFNVDAELDVLLAAIDIDKKENDIRDIATVYASRLLERLDTQEFESQTQYRQAKHVAFQMLKGGIVVQAYDEKIEAVKMKLV